MPRAAPRILIGLGVLAIAIGLGTIVAAHAVVQPRAGQAIATMRRTLLDAQSGMAIMAKAQEAALRQGDLAGRLAEHTDRLSGAAIATIDDMAGATEGLSTASGAVAGVSRRLGLDDDEDDGGRPDGAAESLARLHGDLERLGAEARQVRDATRAVTARTSIESIEQLDPIITGFGDRLAEFKALLDRNPLALGVALLADMVAGIYLLLGAALIGLGATARPAPPA